MLCTITYQKITWYCHLKTICWESESLQHLHPYRVVILENKGEAFIIVAFLNTTKIKLKSPDIAES